MAARKQLLAIILFFVNASIPTLVQGIWCYNATLYQFWGDPTAQPTLPKSANLISDCDECSKTKAVKIVGDLTIVMTNWMCIKRSLFDEDTFMSDRWRRSAKRYSEMSQIFDPIAKRHHAKIPALNDDYGNYQLYDDVYYDAEMSQQSKYPKQRCTEVMQFGQISAENFAMELCSCCTNICNSVPGCGVTWLSIFESIALRK